MKSRSVASLLILLNTGPVVAQSVAIDDHLAAATFGDSIQVFERVATDWIPFARLGSGYCVAVSGDNVMVGSDVFERAGGTFTKVYSGTLAGRSCAIFGNVAVMGDGYEVLVVERRDSRWQEAAVLGNRETWKAFGQSVAVWDMTIAVGAPATDEVYLYRRDGGDWQLHQVLRPSLPESDSFGWGVCVNQDLLVVGVTQGNTVYTYSDNGTDWIEGQKLGPELDDYTSGYGKSVACGDPYIIVSGSLFGSVIYRRSGSGFHPVAFKGGGDIAATSDYVNFGGNIIDVDFLTPPVVINPSDGAIEVPLDHTFAWNSDATALAYSMQLSTDYLWRPWLTDIINVPSILDTTVVLNSLVSGTRYYWIIKNERVLETGGWSLPQVFRTVLVDPPELRLPKDGAVNLPALFTISWHEQSAAEQYHFQLSQDSTFQVRDLDLLKGPCSGWVHCLPPAAVFIGENRDGTLAPGTTYYWRVMSLNSRAATAWSETWRFTTAAEIPAPPPVPVLRTPADGETVRELPVRLAWSVAERATRYELHVTTSPLFAFLDVDVVVEGDTLFDATTLEDNRTYFWRVQAGNDGGTSGWSSVGTFKTTTLATSAERPSRPVRFSLSQSFPNPFNPTTTISYDLPQLADVTLTVVDLLGRQVRELASGPKPAGTYEVSFDAGALSSGIYFYRLKAGDFVETRRMVVVK